MGLRHAISRLWIALALAALSGLLPQASQAAERKHGRSIEFSDSKTPSSTLTNMDQMSTRKDGLRVLEEELNKSLQGLSGKGVLEEAMPAPPIRLPPPMRPVPSKRAQELLEQKKYWVFMNPEDLAKTPTLEEMLKTPEYGAGGQEKEKKTPLERYFESLGRKKGDSRSSPDSIFSSPGRPETGAGKEPELPNGIRESEQALRKALGGESGVLGNTFAARGSLSDIFGLGRDRESPHAPLENSYLQQYKELLGGSSVVAREALYPTTPAQSPAAANLPPRLESYSSGGPPDWMSAPAGAINPAYSPTAPADPTTKVLNQWNSLYNPSAPKPPQVIPAPPAQVEMPKRRF